MPRQPRLHKFPSLGPGGFHRVAYTEWGDPGNPHIVVCVHGLTRNARDFDELAEALSARARVVCMDVVGRGESDWLTRKKDYGFSLYLSDAAALLARVMASPPDGRPGLIGRLGGRKAAPRLDWIGTSMGGLLGMMLAGKPRAPFRRLVLNDVGPMVPWSALLRLKGAHGGVDERFASIEEVEIALRAACADFGPLTDAQWRAVARHGAWKHHDGTWSLAFDPGIVKGLGRGGVDGVAFGNDFLSGIDLWPTWEQVRCPALVIRGEKSDLLTAATAAEMAKRGPRATVVEIEGVGHAPWLKSPNQIAVVEDFLFGEGA